MGKGANEMNEHSADEIQQEIRRTETELGETIQAIQEKLSPARLKAEAREKAKEVATKAATRIKEAVKAKPGVTAAAVAGAGAAVFFMLRHRKKKAAAARSVAACTEEAACPPLRCAPCEPGTVRQGGDTEQEPTAGRPGLGAVALVIGAVVGALLPASAGERKVYGALMDRFRKTGSNAAGFPWGARTGNLSSEAHEQPAPVIK